MIYKLTKDVVKKVETKVNINPGEIWVNELQGFSVQILDCGWKQIWTGPAVSGPGDRGPLDRCAFNVQAFIDDGYKKRSSRSKLSRDGKRTKP